MVAALLASGCGQAPSGAPERVLIPEGSSFAAATDSLEAHGLVAFRPWFWLVARVGGYDRSIKPGLYEFTAAHSARAILRTLRDGKYLTARLTVPEGFTVVDIADLVQSRLPLPRDSVFAAVRDTALLRQHGITAPTAEGYLAPETYIVPAHYSAREIVVEMLEQFDKAWDPSWDAGAAAAGLSRHQTLVLASIVEGEARLDDDRPLIAGVYLNRLRLRMPLQADPTVQYAIQLQTSRRKPRLFNADYRVSSPYNTYLHPGLPPGPVGAPGRKSIEAVLNPARVPYLYFVAGPDGRHVFTRTYNEHLRAVARARKAR
jgi:UPF0755 protein